MTTMIETRGLTKRFGRAPALDGLDLRVESGEIHAFLGPNGAGKSTTIRVLLGLLRADAGEARLLGGDPWRDAVELHRRVASATRSRSSARVGPCRAGASTISGTCTAFASRRESAATLRASRR